MAKKALMCCHNHWTSPFRVGSHHIARELVSAGFEVAFISAPVSPLHVFGGWTNELKERVNIFSGGGGYDLENNLWHYVPASLVTPQNKPLLNSYPVARYWHKTIFKNIAKLLATKGFDKIDILYFDNCYYYFMLDIVKFKKSVYRIADKNSGFTSSTKHSDNLEKQLASRVDCVAYTAHSLEKYVKSMNPKRMIYLPNGVFYDHFKEAALEAPREYSAIARPIILYVGAIDDWFDFDTINRTAEKLPDASFVFIGPDKKAREKLLKYPNMHILGRRDFRQIPDYIHNADIGIIPFNVSKYPELVNSIHPLKLYEYMACGLPVIASRWRELELMNTPARLYSDENEFATMLKETIKKLPDIDKSVFTNFASKCDWRLKVEELVEKIGV